jgi:hypothetical protein
VPNGTIFSPFCHTNSTSTCATSTLRNIVNGYTVEYATAAWSLVQILFEYANAGGSVIAPEIIPAMVK